MTMLTSTRTLLLGCGAAAALLVAGCAGGNGGTFTIPATVTMSGKLSYERFRSKEDGLDTDRLIVTPSRGITVESIDIFDANGNSQEVVFATAVTDANGRFTINVPPGEEFRLRAKPILGDAWAGGTGFGAGVGDVDFTFLPKLSDFGAEMTIDNGWAANDFSNPRDAARFAICDTIYQCMAGVRSLSGFGGTTFPATTLSWSTTSSTTFYNENTNTLAVAGDIRTANNQRDFDEFDYAPIAVEWVERWTRSISRYESTDGALNSHFPGVPGSPYRGTTIWDFALNTGPRPDSDGEQVGGGTAGEDQNPAYARDPNVTTVNSWDILHHDIVDDTFAWQEGLELGLSQILLAQVPWFDGFVPGTYADSVRPNFDAVEDLGFRPFSISGAYFNLENDRVLDTRTYRWDFRDPTVSTDPRKYDGYWSMHSIAELLWDAYDSGATNSDGDTSDAGAAAILTALTGTDFQNSPYFLTANVFFYHLRENAGLNAAEQDDLDDTAIAENIFIGNVEYDATGNPDLIAAGRQGASVNEYHEKYRRYTTLTPLSAATDEEQALDEDGVLQLATRNTFVNATNTGTNKLWQYIYFRAIATTTGTYTVKIWPDNVDAANARWYRPRPAGSGMGTTVGTGQTLTFTATAGATIVFAVSLNGNADTFQIGLYEPGVTPPTNPVTKILNN